MLELPGPVSKSSAYIAQFSVSDAKFSVALRDLQLCRLSAYSGCARPFLWVLALVSLSMCAISVVPGLWSTNLVILR